MKRFFRNTALIYLGWFAHGLSGVQLLICSGVAIAVLGGLSVYERRLRHQVAALTQLAPEKSAQAVSTITIRQMLLIEQMMDDTNQHRVVALMELWKSIYGEDPDSSRTLTELSDEVSVALSQMTS